MSPPPLLPEAMAAMNAAATLFDIQLALVRKAGYPIADGFWDVRPPHELKLLDLAGGLHTALASIRLTERGTPVPPPDNGGTWPEQAEALWDQLTTAAAALEPGSERL